MAGVLSKLDANFYNILRNSHVQTNGLASKICGLTGSAQKLMDISENMSATYSRSNNAKARSHAGSTNERKLDTRMENRNRTVSENTRNRDTSDIARQSTTETAETSNERVSSNRNQSEYTSRRGGDNININQSDSIATRTDTDNINRNQMGSVDTRTGRNSSHRNQTDPDDSRRVDDHRNGRNRTTSNPEKSEQSFSDRLGIVLYNPKYRQYATPDSRLKSYDKWPKDKKMSVNVLANAGFAYTGVADSVRCFYCGGALKDWPDDADPWKEHALKFQHCGHLRQCKGEAYIKHIRGEADSDCEIDGDGDDVIDRVEVAIKRNKDAVTAARDFCTDENLLRNGIKRLLLEKDTFSGVELVKATEQIKDDLERQEESARIAEAACLECESSESETEAESDLEIVEENRKLKDPIMCKICFDAIACIITLPCGHMVSCSQCISALSKCAICRAQIKGTVRALMAV